MKQTIVAKFDKLSRICLKGTRKCTNILNRVRLCSGQDMNWYLPNTRKAAAQLKPTFLILITTLTLNIRITKTD
jgi:hypothetical protein